MVNGVMLPLAVVERIAERIAADAFAGLRLVAALPSAGEPARIELIFVRQANAIVRPLVVNLARSSEGSLARELRAALHHALADRAADA